MYNDFNVTDKLNVDAGLRYEKAKYNGTKHTDSSQIIKMKKDKNGSYENGLERAFWLYGMLNKLRLKNESGNENEHTVWATINKVFEKEMEEKGKVEIPMLKIDIKSKETKTNLGGHLGLNYKLNNTDTIYGRYERAFNSPLPTQFTNKTIDPRTKVNAYWESHIKSENMDNFELGFRGALNDNITYSVAGFMSNTHNEILSLVKNGSSHMMREWRYINLEKTRRLGIELQSQQIFDKLKLKESFTYVDPKILSDDMERTVEQVYKDAVGIGLKRNIEWYKKSMEREMKLDKKEDIDNISFEDRKDMTNKLVKLVEDVTYKRVDETKAKNRAKAIVKTYKKKYSGIDTGYFFTRLHPEKSVEYVGEYEEKLTKVYRDELNYVVKGKFLKKGDKIPLTPKVKATFSADYQFTDKFDLGTNFTYIGSYDSAEPVNGYGIKTVKVPHHLVADLYGTYRFTPNTEVKFGVNNVFDHKHYLRQDSKTATPAPGRTYSLGFTHRF